MSTTVEEEVQNAIDVEAQMKREYILSNGQELYNFLFSRPDVLEQVANLMVMHWNKPNAFAHTVKQQIEQDLLEECADEARERVYG